MTWKWSLWLSWPALKQANAIKLLFHLAALGAGECLVRFGEVAKQLCLPSREAVRLALRHLVAIGAVECSLGHGFAAVRIVPPEVAVRGLSVCPEDRNVVGAEPFSSTERASYARVVSAPESRANVITGRATTPTTALAGTAEYTAQVLSPQHVQLRFTWDIASAGCIEPDLSTGNSARTESSFDDAERAQHRSLPPLIVNNSNANPNLRLEAEDVLKGNKPEAVHGRPHNTAVPKITQPGPQPIGSLVGTLLARPGLSADHAAPPPVTQRPPDLRQESRSSAGTSNHTAEQTRRIKARTEALVRHAAELGSLMDARQARAWAERLERGELSAATFRRLVDWAEGIHRASKGDFSRALIGGLATEFRRGHAATRSRETVGTVGAA